MGRARFRRKHGGDAYRTRLIALKPINFNKELPTQDVCGASARFIGKLLIYTVCGFIRRYLLVNKLKSSENQKRIKFGISYKIDNKLSGLTLFLFSQQCDKAEAC